jgi:hypothetical protein
MSEAQWMEEAATPFHNRSAAVMQRGVLLPVRRHRGEPMSWKRHSSQDWSNTREGTGKPAQDYNSTTLQETMFLLPMSLSPSMMLRPLS